MIVCDPGTLTAEFLLRMPRSSLSVNLDGSEVFVRVLCEGVEPFEAFLGSLKVLF